jgi:hypothetical protein
VSALHRLRCLKAAEALLQKRKNVRDSSNGACESDFVPRSFKRSWDCVQIGSKPSSLICYSDVAAMVHGNRWPLSFLLAHSAIGTEKSASVELSKLLGSVGCITAYLEKCSLPAAVQKSASRKFHHIGTGKRAYDP